MEAFPANYCSLVTVHKALYLVNSHVCVLKQRPDPAQGGVLRWSLPFHERCLCQGVVAPRQSPAHLCTELDIVNKLWYVDDPTPLTNRIYWNKESLDILLDRAEYCDVDECTLDTDNCDTNAACTNTAGSFTCGCNAGYSGDGVTCTAFPRSCEEISPDLATESNVTLIDPDGPGNLEPFNVTCTTDGITQVHHDLEPNHHVNGPEDPGSYVRSITYIDTSLEQIVALIRISADCRQFIEIKCYGSTFHSGI
ncbi:uncharacterized protein [Amphiura filiformis]|uniref:uncharacterized protein n=1 Tax=Amphiura filiformis TaxID=82378 RepID=UPI003B21C6A2